MADSRREQVIAACSAKPGAAEDYPFGDEVAVFKVAGRMFALVPLAGAPGSVSVLRTSPQPCSRTVAPTPITLRTQP
jgi:predicted DNA-binding protein (MmcQ/YjbR family)